MTRRGVVEQFGQRPDDVGVVFEHLIVVPADAVATALTVWVRKLTINSQSDPTWIWIRSGTGPLPDRQSGNTMI